MAYTDIDKPSDYFETKLYTGNAGTLNVTGLDFQPDWVWIKNRTSDYTHGLYDSVRGAGSSKGIYSNTNEAEGTNSAFQNLTSFNSDGFSLGSTSNTNVINTNSQNHVSWNWKAGTSFTNDASATGIGTIDSTGSVNTDAGFSIVSYTGNGSAGATIFHGLGATPAMILQKIRSGTGNWLVYHHKNTSAPATEFVRLNETTATNDELTIWNDTAPTSSVFSVGTESTINGSGNTCVAYCFAEKQGYSKFGSYTGNGNADGTFVYTGFKPSFILRKRTDTTSAWLIQDNKRDGINRAVTNSLPTDQNVLRANDSSAEEFNNELDILSNGFKLRATDAFGNASGGTYIYMAFAENPFVTSTGVPATAR